MHSHLIIVIAGPFPDVISYTAAFKFWKLLQVDVAEQTGIILTNSMV